MKEVYKEIQESGHSSAEVITLLFLSDREHGNGVICSGLRCPENDDYQSFDVEFESGARHRISFKIEVLTPPTEESKT